MSYSISHLIGKKILFYRKKNGLSVNELSEVIGISPQQQSRYERGINRITLDRLFQYATYFEIDIQSFFQSIDI
ncbi:MULTISPECIES: helix-turn-helix domain-containing protein [Providencia]|uniref:helix-turn-helix domain-containing protein n=1 Tax=Providencia TaxID=586 RepID=UPI0018C6177D|nr:MULTISPECIES: helix-turn-helix transcriptional regulator [Providencia]EJD6047968.1 helix-turn-helix transcriptional regulator [Providencia rettgeri]EJD6049819.1 helix-turn-helix transcriptional regulator [Providencia rettgeri]ELR5091453.1 helix-turn-helix transcriptional regulator [Providencia rettgeri]ELR5093439.1 helix-turn-helix transcriptional regulator [Providencia rettgeri]ELR5105286.1 helix-turn-helix transcriptional regulator [Providencia rettgeri]